MSVIYLTRKTCKLSKDAGRLVVRDNDEIKVSIPAINVTGVVVTSDAQISTQVIRVLLAQGSYIIYTDWRGNFTGLATANRGSLSNALLQISLSDDEKMKLRLVKYIVRNKLENQIEVIKLYAKYHSSMLLHQIARSLNKYFTQIEKAGSVGELRGIEGICAKEYFSIFGEITNHAGFEWLGRTRRPAEDEVNALLNYGYAFLEREIRVITMGAGLDERYGFLHSNNGRKDSLIFDLMELVRQSVIDKLILYSLCRKRIKKTDFEKIDDGYFLTDEGRGKWLNIYEQWMQEDKHGRALIESEVKNFVQEMKACLGDDAKCAI